MKDVHTNTTMDTTDPIRKQHVHVQGSPRAPQLSAGRSPVLTVTSMDDNRIYTTDKILSLTLEIMLLLTGEDYTIVEKTYIDHILSGGRIPAEETVPMPTTESVGHHKSEEILQLIKQIIQLLTGEVPVRCQDVAVYFSIEEWDYIDKNKNLYENIVLDDQQLPSQGQMLSTPKYEIDDDLIEKPSCDSTAITIKSTTDGSCASSDLSQKETMPADIVDPDDLIGPAQGPLSCTEGGGREPLTPKHEIEDDVIEEPLTYFSTTPIRSTDEGDYITSDLAKQEPMYAGSTDCVDGVGTAQEPLSWLGHRNCFGAQAISSPKHEIEDDVIEESSPDLDSTALTGDAFIFSEFSIQRPMPAGCTARDDFVSTAQELLSCSECGKCFRFRSRLITHERTHTGEKPFSCPECGKCFIRRSQLVQHTKIHTGEAQCTFCGKCFTQKSKLTQHERTHTGERPYSCHQCGQCFAQEATLTKHERIHTGEKPFSCSECGKCFMLKSYLRCHQRTHTGEKPFSCPYCDKGFAQKSHLSEHIKIHTGAKLFSCSECNKRFTQKSGLILHQRLHTGEKPFTCSECGKSFIKKAQLVQHKRIHTAEEQCLACGKCFTHKSKLIDHQRTHTGERPFTCIDCGKSFALKTTLARHQRLHTGEKLLYCAVCGKGFMQKSDLCRHQRTHTEQQPLC
ncbi:uncharacterized protein ACNLHF_022952 isoform 1-T2 [Anomaloglossus baeobatrachus]|uniref:uncharacterized protein LOC142243581 n=1 Tax=Anomaloglossus baeobatrachus TaxID=238106 RepID=UPI003F4FC00D